MRHVYHDNFITKYFENKHTYVRIYTHIHSRLEICVKNFWNTCIHRKTYNDGTKRDGNGDEGYGSLGSE